jgi:phosphatidylglycerophosphate synthase
VSTGVACWPGASSRRGGVHVARFSVWCRIVFDHLLRGFKDRLLAPLAALLRGVSPNVLTCLALLIGLGGALAAWRGAFIAGLALWILNRVVDGLDGAVARLAGTHSDFGGYLDVMLDTVVYAAIPVGFALGARSTTVLTAALVLEATFFVNTASWMYLAAVLEKRQAGAAVRGELTTITMPPALIAGTETVVLFSLFYLFPAHLSLLFFLMAALVAFNVVQRLIWARRGIS